MARPIGLFSETSLNGPRNVREYYRELGQQIVLGDKLGFDFFSCTQSYGLDFADSTFSISPDPLALFAAQIPLTEKIKILTAITIAPFHHPAMALSDAAAIDNLSDGRVMLGVGRGHPWLYDRMGLDQSESRARFTEFGTMARTILDDQTGRHTLKGKFWNTDDFELLPKFVQQDPEVYVAVIGGPPSALEAARNRFGLIFPSYLGMKMDDVLVIQEAYQAEHNRLWGCDGKTLLGIHASTLEDAELANRKGVESLAGQLKVFARNMVEFSAKLGPDYPAYGPIGEFFTMMAEPENCQRMVAEEWPTYMAVWGNAEQSLPKFEELVNAVKPHGLIINIDAGGVDHGHVIDSMNYFGDKVLAPLQEILDAS
ncbi:MAG: LLM class flavin-dependent oxidoreductase [Immundisolibacteraceae bacterium]|nr:LLM class flavin-dependent oxidoreductase [Immundisolibacteraceae bacterium]